MRELLYVNYPWRSIIFKIFYELWSTNISVNLQISLILCVESLCGERLESRLVEIKSTAYLKLIFGW